MNRLFSVVSGFALFSRPVGKHLLEHGFARRREGRHHLLSPLGYDCRAHPAVGVLHAADEAQPHHFRDLPTDRRWIAADVLGQVYHADRSQAPDPHQQGEQGAVEMDVGGFQQNLVLARAVQKAGEVHQHAHQFRIILVHDTCLSVNADPRFMHDTLNFDSGHRR